MIQLVDDQILGRVVRGEVPPTAGADVFTTGYWYVRLCQAVVGASARTGVLATPFARLPPAQNRRAIERLLELPARIGLLSLRDLAPLIGQLRRSYDLNALGAEALAAAVSLQADVFLSAPSPRLAAALQNEGLRVNVESAPT